MYIYLHNYVSVTSRRTPRHTDSITSDDSDLTAWKRSTSRDVTGSKQRAGERYPKLGRPLSTSGAGEILINSSLGFKEDPDDVTEGKIEISSVFGHDLQFLDLLIL